MRQFKVLATTPAKANYNFFSGESYYFADSLLYVEMYSGQQSIVITDVTNAMKPGKTCQQVKFSGVWNSNKCEVANLLHQYGDDFRQVFAALAEIPAVKYNGGTDVVLRGIEGRAYNSEEPSIKQFSPFATVNRLKEVPAKWTLAHVVRALVNGQFTGLKCNHHYTDDYAWDAAVNFQQGSIVPTGLIQELVDSKSGWWVSADKSGYLTVACYSFKSYGFTLDLSGKAAPLQFDKTEEEQEAATAAYYATLNGPASEVSPEPAAAPEPVLSPLAQAVADYRTNYPAATCEAHQCGSMLLSYPIEDDDSASLFELCRQVGELGIVREINPEGDFLYLAIFPNSKHQTPPPTPPAPTPEPEPQPLAVALASVMHIVRDEQPTTTTNPTVAHLLTTRARAIAYDAHRRHLARLAEQSTRAEKWLIGLIALLALAGLN